jgi:hypothetical protein
VADDRVFIGEVRLQNGGRHIGTFWSDRDRISHGECSCAANWDVTTGDAEVAIDRWREHHDQAELEFEREFADRAL